MAPGDRIEIGTSASRAALALTFPPTRAGRSACTRAPACRIRGSARQDRAVKSAAGGADAATLLARATAPQAAAESPLLRTSPGERNPAPAEQAAEKGPDARRASPEEEAAWCRCSAKAKPKTQIGARWRLGAGRREGSRCEAGDPENERLVAAAVTKAKPTTQIGARWRLRSRPPRRSRCERRVLRNGGWCRCSRRRAQRRSRCSLGAAEQPREGPDASGVLRMSGLVAAAVTKASQRRRWALIGGCSRVLGVDESSGRQSQVRTRSRPPETKVDREAQDRFVHLAAARSVGPRDSLPRTTRRAR